MSCSDLNCVVDVVRFINDLQDAVDFNDDCPDSCLRPQLGAVGGVVDNPPNTRPFLLYTKKGKLFEAYYRSAGTQYCPSPIFRVESIDGTCAVLRVLVPQSPSSSSPRDRDCENFGGELRRTDQCVVVDLACFCAIQCLNDQYIAGV